MKLSSYVMTYDEGFAPNPYHGYLTLATCKPVIRKHASVGDFIIGTGCEKRNDKENLIYIMKVTEILTFEEYSTDERFVNKIPRMDKNKVLQVGDNIYHYKNGVPLQMDSVHSDANGNPVIGHQDDDLSGENVLISEEFVYYGHNSKKIPERFMNKDETKDIRKHSNGHKNHTVESFDNLLEFIDWAFERESTELRVLGRPSDW